MCSAIALITSSSVASSIPLSSVISSKPPPSAVPSSLSSSVPAPIATPAWWTLPRNYPTFESHQSACECIYAASGAATETNTLPVPQSTVFITEIVSTAVASTSAWPIYFTVTEEVIEQETTTSFTSASTGSNQATTSTTTTSTTTTAPIAPTQTSFLQRMQRSASTGPYVVLGSLFVKYDDSGNTRQAFVFVVDGGPLSFPGEPFLQAFVHEAGSSTGTLYFQHPTNAGNAGVQAVICKVSLQGFMSFMAPTA
ncbi:hypothetical protein B0T25DRAFT_516312 [Lasiosphaeria hispida]|uniref:Uncharacterized protein n=1 Tax=Lasiosphaeria hispida TaxID=260671 RepID=A0AAJ0MFG8_9PEZI|nr:hypothetical protein B0T25DRAFT_516312 [Lasiosphaeria hispida]